MFSEVPIDFEDSLIADIVSGLKEATDLEMGIVYIQAILLLTSQNRYIELLVELNFFQSVILVATEKFQNDFLTKSTLEIIANCSQILCLDEQLYNPVLLFLNFPIFSDAPELIDSYFLCCYALISSAPFLYTDLSNNILSFTLSHQLTPKSFTYLCWILTLIPYNALTNFFCLQCFHDKSNILCGSFGTDAICAYLQLAGALMPQQNVFNLHYSDFHPIFRAKKGLQSSVSSASLWVIDRILEIDETQRNDFVIHDSSFLIEFFADCSFDEKKEISCLFLSVLSKLDDKGVLRLLSCNAKFFVELLELGDFGIALGVIQCFWNALDYALESEYVRIPFLCIVESSKLVEGIEESGFLDHENEKLRVLANELVVLIKSETRDLEFEFDNEDLF
jgi:hypothetical protein